MMGIRHSLRLLSCATIVLGWTCLTATAQTADSLGRDFIVTFLPNLSPSTVELHLTTPVTRPSGVPVIVEYPVGTYYTNATIFAGQIEVVSLPPQASTLTPSSSRNSVRVFTLMTLAEFTMYMVNREGFTSDAALALPINALNTRYIVTDYRALSANDFVVTAVNNDTQVVITPSLRLSTRQSANVPFTVNLTRGESFFGTGFSRVTGLSGTLIQANRPVTVISGNRCTNVPTGVAACDHVFEVAHPVQAWGTTFVAANLPQRPSGSIYRIYASEDNTNITVTHGTNTFTLLLAARAYHETASIPESIFVESDKPAFVTQFMTGAESPLAIEGDPAMGNVVPIDQFLTQYTFATVGNEQFEIHYLSIVAIAEDVGTLTLDGVPVPSANFTIVGDGPWYTAVLLLAEGTHSTTSSSAVGHGITVEGYNSFDSYLYPGGARFGIVNQAGDTIPPVCFETGGSNTTVFGNASDIVSEDSNGNSILDEGEDTNSNGQLDVASGILSVFVASSSTNLQVEVSDSFIPGDGTADFTVTRIDEDIYGNGTVVAMDGGGNICTIDVLFPGPVPVECSPDINEFFTEVMVDVMGNPDLLTPTQQAAIGSAYASSYNEFAALYCDVLFRTVLSATVVEVGEPFQEGRLRLLQDTNMTNTTDMNNTIVEARPFFVRLLIRGACRGCGRDADLYDNVRRALQVIAEVPQRRLQVGNLDCFCPITPIADRAPSAQEFETFFNQTIVNLGIDGVDVITNVQEQPVAPSTAVVPVECSPDVNEFLTEVVLDVVGDPGLVTQSDEAAIELAFATTYNQLAALYCDVVFRAVFSATVLEVGVPMEQGRTRLLQDSNSTTNTTAVAQPFFIRLLIRGVCRGCGRDADLYDNVRRALQVIVEVTQRRLQEVGDSTCFCPAMPVAERAPSIEEFAAVFNQTIVELGLDSVGAVTGVREQPVAPSIAPPVASPSTSLVPVECSTDINEFFTEFVVDVVGNPDNVTLSDETAIEMTFATTYNALAALYCDLLFRTVLNATIVEIGERMDEGRFRLLQGTNTTDMSNSTIKPRPFFIRLLVTGGCRGCGRDADLTDDTRRSLEVMSDLTFRHLEDVRNTTTCFCPEMPVANRAPSLEEFEFALNRSIIALNLDSVDFVTDVQEQPVTTMAPSVTPSIAPFVIGRLRTPYPTPSSAINRNGITDMKVTDKVDEADSGGLVRSRLRA